MAVDQDKLVEFLNRFVADLGSTMAAGGVVVGDRLGLYSALAAGPLRPDEVAAQTGTAQRYVEEWLRGQSAGGYVEYDASNGAYWLTEEQAFALTDPDGPVYLPGAFQLDLGTLRAEPKITQAFRTGAGVGWHERDPDVFEGCERFFRPEYLANLVTAWLPALGGVEARLLDGARVADIGCGHGASTVLMATAYPRSTFIGFDNHAASIERARERAADAGVAARADFEVATAQDFTGTGYDLVTSFDCLHDTGDPRGAARHIRAALAPGGTWMIIEPYAGEEVADNPNARSARSTTPLPASGAYPLPARGTAAILSARKRARARSGGWRWTRASRGSAGSPRLRSTSCTKHGRDRGDGAGSHGR